MTDRLVPVPPLTEALDASLARAQGLASDPAPFLGLKPHSTTRLEAQLLLLRPPVRSATIGASGLDVYALEDHELELYFRRGLLVAADMALGKVEPPAAWARWGEGEGATSGNALIARRWSPGGRVMEVSRDDKVRILTLHPHRVPRLDHLAAYRLDREALRSGATRAADGRVAFYGLVPGVTSRALVNGALGPGTTSNRGLRWANKRLRQRLTSQTLHRTPGGEVVASFAGETLLCLSLGSREDRSRAPSDDMGRLLPPAMGQGGVLVATNGFVWERTPDGGLIHLVDPAALRDSGMLYRIDPAKVMLVIFAAIVLTIIVALALR